MPFAKPSSRASWTGECDNSICEFVEDRGTGDLVPQVRGDMNKEVNVRHQSGSSRAKTLWKMRDARERCDAQFDQA